MAVIRVLAVQRGQQPQVAYFEQGQPTPHLVRLRRTLSRFVRRHGAPHHFKVQVVVGDQTPSLCYGPQGTALPPSLEGNGLRLHASRSLSITNPRDSTIAFHSWPGLAQQVVISPDGHVASHPVVVDTAA